MLPWQAEVELSAEQAQHLIDTQFPQEGSSLSFLGEGFDNWVYRRGSLVYRFPRKASAAQLLAREIEFLPWLAPEYRYRQIGRPQGQYPFLFAAQPLVVGRSLERAGCSANFPIQWAQWLRQLQQRVVPAHLPRDERGRWDLTQRHQQIFSGLGYLPGWVPQYLTEELLCPNHGDLYCRHILVDDSGDLSGVIDWGDLHLGHPALDLSSVYLLFDPEQRQLFWQHYGTVSQETLGRARYRALYHSLLLRDYAKDRRETWLEAAVETALERILSSEEATGT